MTTFTSASAQSFVQEKNIIAAVKYSLLKEQHLDRTTCEEMPSQSHLFSNIKLQYSLILFLSVHWQKQFLHKGMHGNDNS